MSLQLLRRELVRLDYIVEWTPEEIEEQEKFISEVKEAEQTLEHKYFVGLEYCGWLPEGTAEEKKVKRQVQSCRPYCCFNHQVGMPRRVYKDPETNEDILGEETELYEYQRRIIEQYESSRYYAQNKVRGSGTTELLAVRHMAYKYAVRNRIDGRKYYLAAGTDQSAAIKIFKRIIRLLKPYSNIAYKKIPKVANPKFIEFAGGGEAYAMASTPNAPRGEENVGDVLLDESAFWDLVDDEPVLKAYEPFVAKSGAHMGVFSTPNGQRGFFWTKIFDPETKTKYTLHTVTFKEVSEVPIPIIDIEEAKRLQGDDPDLFAQEFNNKFIIPSGSVFGDEFEQGEHRAEF